uniref:Uncharacterized protein n=1 Tax=Molossus molossus TaxID=27622 RepID=A0A7J8GKY7_MOLMO|nr:hypothetical protein HJG59_011531 [Molossus molossus]
MNTARAGEHAVTFVLLRLLIPDRSTQAEAPLPSLAPASTAVSVWACGLVPSPPPGLLSLGTVTLCPAAPPPSSCHTRTSPSSGLSCSLSEPGAGLSRRGQWLSSVGKCVHGRRSQHDSLGHRPSHPRRRHMGGTVRTYILCSDSLSAWGDERWREGLFLRGL